MGRVGRGADVLEDSLGRRPAPGLARQFANQCDVAEVAPCGRARLFGRQARLDLFFRFLGEMEVDLLFEFGLASPPAEKRTQAKSELLQHRFACASVRRTKHPCHRHGELLPA